MKNVFTSDNYSSSNTNNKLNIVIGEKSAQAAIYDASNGEVLKIFERNNKNLKLSDLELNALLLELKQFNNFEEINLFTNSAYTVLPTKFFNQSESETYLEAVLNVKSSAEMRNDALKIENATIVHKANLELESAAKSILNLDATKNIIASLCANFIENNLEQDVVALLNFFDRKMDAIVLKKGKLQLLNKYDGNSIKNILYYLLNLKKTQKIEHFLYAGKVEKEAELIRLLQKFDINIQKVENKLPIENPHHYHQLAALN